MTGALAEVWVLEDDEEFRELLEEVLTTPRVRVTPFERAQDVLQQLSDAPPPDVLVTDHHLEGVHGLDLVAGLRARGFTAPVLLVTAFADADLRRRARDLSDVEVVEKPCDVLALRRRVRDRLGDLR
ncbi:MAG: response regulator [Myxococcales bacterium]|nr:response regulator [Myxococcales bacterium]MCB9647580.1 response regulator [Deltaproteobacteria bacterium]